MEDEDREINADVFNTNDCTDDIARICAEGFKVDDDSKALPENILPESK
jgi:hypothetical protein